MSDKDQFNTIEHYCSGVEQEIQRLTDIGYYPIVLVNKVVDIDDTFTALVHLYEDEKQSKLISIDEIDVVYCPYCGLELRE